MWSRKYASSFLPLAASTALPTKSTLIWTGSDPIPAFAARLIQGGLSDEKGIQALDEQAEQEVEEAVKYAEESPDPSVDGLFDYIYAPDDAQVGGQ